MTVRRFIPVLLGIAVLSTVAVARADDQPKIAIANPARIFTQMQETKDVISKLDGDRKNLAGIEQQKRQEIKDITDLLKTLNVGTTTYQAKNKELLEKSINLDVWLRLENDDMQRQYKQQVKALFDKIEAMVKVVATERGIDLVISDQRPELPEDLSTVDLNQLRTALLQRTILFSDTKGDLTNDIIIRMDKQYQDKTTAPK